MNANLKDTIENLFDRKVSEHVVLTQKLFEDEKTLSIMRKCNGDIHNGLDFNSNFKRTSYSYRREIIMEGSKFFIHYIPTRYLRSNEELLYELGIKNRDIKRQYYEYDPSPDSPWLIYCEKNEFEKFLPPEVLSRTKQSTIFDYKELNPRGELISVKLSSKDGSQEFNITYNWAPFKEDHFLVYANNNGNTVLKQTYHNKHTLWWMDDLLTRLNCADYRIFYNAKGAGHSMETLHFQLIKNHFPVFEKLEHIYPNKASGLIHTTKHDWPFIGILARYKSDTKERILSDLEEKIKEWISESNNTFNLLCQMKGEYREFFFVFRERGLNYIEGISNGIAGYEIAGNVIIENREEFESFPDEIDEIKLRREK